MKIKTSELTGAALDWAVAKCEGLIHPALPSMLDGGSKFLGVWLSTEDVRYSTNWTQAGPIIEREEIDLMKFNRALWQAAYKGKLMKGPTPLIAAMRCYVASKIGNEVDIPNELIERV